MQCLVLAGGLGNRMRPETARVPKVLLEVGGRPFIEWQLGWLAGQGVTDVVLSVGHLGQMVRSAVADGARFGLSVRYADEGNDLRGTGGAVRLAADLSLLDERFFVLYGDSYLSVDLGAVEEAYVRGDNPALMTVFLNDDRFDTSNVVFADDQVVRYKKSASIPDPQMRYIDYGLSLLSRAVVTEMIPPDVVADLSTLYGVLADEGRLGGYLVSERFYEVGSPQGRAELEAHLGESRAWPGAGTGGSP